MNVKNIVIFISGVVIGGAAGVLGVRNYLGNKYSKQLEEFKEEMEEYYQRTDEYKRVPHEDDCEDRNNETAKEGVSRPGGRMSPEERANIKEKLQKNYEKTTNYASMYRGQRVEMNPIDDSAELEHPEEDVAKTCSNCARSCGEAKGYIGEGDDETSLYCELIGEIVNDEDVCSDWKSPNIENEASEENAFEDHQKNKNKSPKIISIDDYSNLPAHIDQQVLYFYTYDEVLCDENEEMIESPELLVGDALTKYNFVDSDERCIFVINYAIDTCYEIQKVDASWTDSH